MKERLSYSTGKTLIKYRDMPEVAIWKLDNPTPPTQQMIMGTALEQMIAGADDIAVFDGDRRAGDKWKAFSKLNKDKIILKRSEYDTLKVEMELVKALAPSVCEMEYQHHFEFEDRGVNVHGFLDFWDKGSLVVDLKRSDPEPMAFAKTAANFFYALQAYIYHRATGDDFAWLIVGPDEPHPVRLYLPDDQTLRIGAEMYEQAHELFVRYQAGEFVPTKLKTEIVTSPGWLARRFDNHQQEVAV